MVELHLALELNCSPWNVPCRVPASGFVSGFQQKLFSHFQELKDKKALGCQYLKKTKQNLTACIERHLVWHNGWKVAPPIARDVPSPFPAKMPRILCILSGYRRLKGSAFTSAL